ncbi:hypothetical protein [Streptomyces achromogenes]|uniref:hypothetical protein n=1 Tax=Streptomyces achromogenes TaxID=67255 RepID=UPI00368B7557
MTTDDPWQHWTAPDQLLAELDRLRAENRRLAAQIADDEQRITRTLQYTTQALTDRIHHHVHLAHCVRAALTQGRAVTNGPATAHIYLSTGCLHGDLVLPDGRTGHQYCQGDTGQAGAKSPAQCKFCATPCVCPCHQEQTGA